MRRIEVWVGIVVVVLAVTWALAWWLISAYVEGAIDEALAASGEGEVAIACDERGRRGFPFRFETVCSGATARAADGTWRAALEQLRAGALIHRPRTINATFNGPLTLEAAALDGPAAVEWASARGELVADEDGPQRLWLRLFSTSVEVEGTRLMAHQLRLEVAPDEAGGSRLTLDGEQLELAAGPPDLPPIDLTAEARTPIPPTALIGGDVDLTDGARLDDLSLSLETRPVQVHAEGDLAAGPEGLLSGGLTLHLVGLDNLPELVEALPEGVRGGANMGVGALMALAAPAEWQGRPARRVQLTIEDGQIRAGALTLGRLPPLWQAPPAF